MIEFYTPLRCCTQSMMRRGFLGKQLANFLLIFLVITPGMIAYWRGLWLLMDLYFYPNDQNLSAWFSTGLGLSFSFFFVLLQNFWRKLLVRCSSPFRGLIWRVLAYLIGFCSVSAWRGVWMLLGSDHITKSPTLAAGLTHLVGFVVLLLTRSTSTVVFSPGFTLSDFYFVPEELNFLSYHWPALEKRKFGPLLLHVGNCFFTVVVIGVAGVACWRGVWTLLDIWTAGNGRLPSILLSFCLGYSILAGSFCVCGCIHDKIDLPMSRLSQAMEQAFTYILIIGDINLWRAMFYIQDDYIFPGGLWTYSMPSACHMGQSLAPWDCKMHGAKLTISPRSGVILWGEGKVPWSAIIPVISHHMATYL